MTPIKNLAFQYIDEHREDMLSLWREIVHIESGTANKAGVDAIGNRLKQILDEAGAKTRVIPFEKVGNVVTGEFGTPVAGKGLIFMGHMDTVFKDGTLAERPFTIKEGNAYGPGALDMKGGLVILTYAAKALMAAGYSARPLKIILAGDEENGHQSSTAGETLIEESRGHTAVFNCDTGSVKDVIVIGRKGTASITLEVKGVAAHAGNDPQNGRNAIIELSHKLPLIHALADWDRGILVNVGVIQGGTVENAVPDYAKAIIDVRYSELDQINEVKQKVEAIANTTYIQGTTTTVNTRLGIPPMQTTEGVKKLYTLVEKTYAENGWGTPSSAVVGGGSDAAYPIIGGTPSICSLGVKGARNHSPEEYAVVDSLFERAKLLVACVLNVDTVFQ